MNESIYPKFRWFTLIAYMAITSATSFCMIAPAPLIPFIAQGMGVDGGVIGNATMTSFNLFMGLFAFLGGFLLDRIGVFRVWILCLLMVGLGSMLMPMIGTTVSGLFFCRVLHAAGTGPIMASVAALSSQQFEFKERTYVAAFQGFSVCFGVTVGQYLVPIIYQAVGKRLGISAGLDLRLSRRGPGIGIHCAFGPHAACGACSCCRSRNNGRESVFAKL